MPDTTVIQTDFLCRGKKFIIFELFRMYHLYHPTFSKAPVYVAAQNIGSQNYHRLGSKSLGIPRHLKVNHFELTELFCNRFVGSSDPFQSMVCL